MSRMALVCMAILLAAGACFAVDAQIINGSLGVQSVRASAAYKVYADSLGANQDFGLRLCGAGPKYVAAAYGANVSGSYIYTAISKNLTFGATNSMVYAGLAQNASCYYTPIDAYAFSQFRDFTRTPRVYVAAFPARITAVYSDSQDGSSPAFRFMNGSDGWLRGSYNRNQPFLQATGMVSADITSINFTTDAGDLSYSPSDADWGLSSSTGRSMAIALCTDSEGLSCNAGQVVNSSAQLPVQLPLGMPYHDQVTYTRYVVINGLGTSLCIGANLVAGMTASTPVSYGSNSSVAITITNSGNVNSTTDYKLYLNISGPGGYGSEANWTITENLMPGQSTARYYNWTALGLSGTYVLNASIDPEGTIAECSRSDNNATRNVAVTPVYTAHARIDDNETNVFPRWGRMYNVTLWVTTSDGPVLTDTSFRLIEKNGLNPFAPMQVWNDSGTQIGIRSWSVGEVRSNSSGYARLAAIPTCNFFYSVNSSEGVEPYVGGYWIILNAYLNNSQLTLFSNNSLAQDYVFVLANNSCTDPGWVNNQEVLNKNRYVTAVYDWLYQMYALVKKLVVP